MQLDGAASSATDRILISKSVRDGECREGSGGETNESAHIFHVIHLILASCAEYRNFCNYVIYVKFNLNMYFFVNVLISRGDKYPMGA